MAQSNISNNNLGGIQLLPYAISDTDGVKQFHISCDYSMASSLETRRYKFKDKIHLENVQCRKLNQFIDYNVQFLKLDIEGSEVSVIKNLPSHLKLIDSLFCEYHGGAGQEHDGLPAILQILSDNNFDYHVNKSLSSSHSTRFKPLNYVSNPFSLSIWAQKFDLK